MPWSCSIKMRFSARCASSLKMRHSHSPRSAMRHCVLPSSTATAEEPLPPNKPARAITTTGADLPHPPRHAICFLSPPKGVIAMSLIHLHNEVVTSRALDAESWSTYISFSLDDSSKTIVAETFWVYQNKNQPLKNYRHRMGRQRVSYN